MYRKKLATYIGNKLTCPAADLTMACIATSALCQPLINAVETRNVSVSGCLPMALTAGSSVCPCIVT